jgi:hypothetical protein
VSLIGRILASLVLFGITVTSYSQAASLSADQSAANSVVNSYFIALSQGDTVTIKSLLGGDLLEKRKRLLDNPTYQGQLTSIYNNARLNITSNVISNDSIAIDGVITLNSGETLHRRYLLRKDFSSGAAGRYIIYSESAPEELEF